MFYVMFRDPESLLNDDFKIMGSAPTQGYEKEEDAIAAAQRLFDSMYYDVTVVYRMQKFKCQVGSRMKP